MNAENGAPVWKKFTRTKHIGVAAAVLLLLGFVVLGAWSEKYKHSFAFGNKASTDAAAAEPLSAQTNTPQLSKEYIYAGGRMLAVEDANVQAPDFSGISGRVIYGVPNSQPDKSVLGVYLSITGSPQNWMNGSYGSYQFTELVPNANYTITPSKPGQELEGAITPFDAVLVLRCVAAGVAACDLTPNQKIAADASNGGGITPFDATVILRYVAAGADRWMEQQRKSVCGNSLPPPTIILHFQAR